MDAWMHSLNYDVTSWADHASDKTTDIIHIANARYANASNELNISEYRTLINILSMNTPPNIVIAAL